MAFDFHGLNVGDDIVGKFWTPRADRAPVCGELVADGSEVRGKCHVVAEGKTISVFRVNRSVGVVVFECSAKCENRSF